MPIRSNVPAIASVLLAATLWGLFWYPLRRLETAGLGGLWATLVIYASACLVLFPFCLRGVRAVAWRADWRDLAVMALASGICNVTFILAVIEGEVVRVLLLFYLSPLWTIVLGWLLLRERPAAADWWVIVAAMSGAVVMLWEPRVGYPLPGSRADWLALVSGFSFALANVEIRKLQGVPVIHKTFLSWLGVLMVALGWLAFTGGLEPPAVGPDVWAAAALLGMFGMVVMTLSVQYGVTHLPVHRSAILLLFELVAGALSSWWLAGETLRLSEWVGGSLIVLAALMAAYRPDGMEMIARDASGEVKDTGRRPLS